MCLTSVCPELVRAFSDARCHGCRAQLREITFAGGGGGGGRRLLWCAHPVTYRCLCTLMHTCGYVCTCVQADKFLPCVPTFLVWRYALIVNYNFMLLAKNFTLSLPGWIKIAIAQEPHLRYRAFSRMKALRALATAWKPSSGTNSLTNAIP